MSRGALGMESTTLRKGVSDLSEGDSPIFAARKLGQSPAASTTFRKGTVPFSLRENWDSPRRRSSLPIWQDILTGRPVWQVAEDGRRVVHVHQTEESSMSARPHPTGEPSPLAPTPCGLTPSRKRSCRNRQMSKIRFLQCWYRLGTVVAIHPRVGRRGVEGSLYPWKVVLIQIRGKIYAVW